MIIDLHCDTIQRAKDENLELDSKKLAINTIDLENNLPYIQVLGTFVSPKYNIGDEGYKRAISIIENFYKIYNKDKMYIIKNKEDFESAELQKKVGVLLSIENGSAISSDLKNIDNLYEKGIRMMGIVWNDDNELSSGAATKNDTGLTELGKMYVKQLQNKNIIIDVSHMSKKGFYDTLKSTEVPVIASHSCSNSICNHRRNLDDDQIKQIAKREGVIGICFCKPFLTKENKATVKDVVKHIDYIVNLVGINYVALGSDFDGVEEENRLQDIKGVIDMPKIIIELKHNGYSEEDIKKITSDNFLRVANKVIVKQ